MRPGRKPHTKRDAVFGMVHKVYGLFSARRFTGDRKAARRAGDRSRPKGGQGQPVPGEPSGAPRGRGGPRRGPPPHRASTTERASGSRPGGREVAVRPRGRPHWPVAASQGTLLGSSGGWRYGGG